MHADGFCILDERLVQQRAVGGHLALKWDTGFFGVLLAASNCLLEQIFFQQWFSAEKTDASSCSALKDIVAGSI